MSEALSQELDDLESLLGNPGWKWLVKYAESRWLGDSAFRQRINAAARGQHFERDTIGLIAAESAVRALVEAPNGRIYEIQSALREGKRREDDPWRHERRVP